MPEKGHCACKFSSGGVLSKCCEFHTRWMRQEIENETKACAATAEQCEIETTHGWREAIAAAIRARLSSTSKGEHKDG